MEEIRTGVPGRTRGELFCSRVMSGNQYFRAPSSNGTPPRVGGCPTRGGPACPGTCRTFHVQERGGYSRGRFAPLGRRRNQCARSQAAVVSKAPPGGGGGGGPGRS